MASTLTPFVDWIMQWISTPRIFNLVVRTGRLLIASSGLRLGDPIPPYLFIKSMEYLSRMIYKTESLKLIKGIRSSRNNISKDNKLSVSD